MVFDLDTAMHLKGELCIDIDLIHVPYYISGST